MNLSIKEEIKRSMQINSPLQNWYVGWFQQVTSFLPLYFLWRLLSGTLLLLSSVEARIFLWHLFEQVGHISVIFTAFSRYYDCKCLMYHWPVMLVWHCLPPCLEVLCGDMYVYVGRGLQGLESNEIRIQWQMSQDTKWESLTPLSIYLTTTDTTGCHIYLC